MFDDDTPKKTPSEFPRNLETMSVSEITHYIDDLKTEISRAQADIEAKKASKSAADLAFKI